MEAQGISPQTLLVNNIKLWMGAWVDATGIPEGGCNWDAHGYDVEPFKREPGPQEEPRGGQFLQYMLQHLYFHSTYRTIVMVSIFTFRKKTKL